MFSLKECKKLVELARRSIESFFSKESIDFSEYSEFSKKQGVFVTLNLDGELRGCIGFPEPVYPLSRAVVEAARSAAFGDPRFPPVSKKELDDITIEISVLTVPEPVRVKKPEEYLDMIDIGADGLIIRGDFGSGLLLPQVPVEQGWDAREFLKHICIKAGLPTDAWKDLGNKIYKFQAQIFEEKEPRGDVIEKKL